MSWNNKVIWTEGMFLRPVHFQQQDRHMQSYVQARVKSLRPYSWGFSELQIDEALLEMGKLALTSARGVFPDGTPFMLPQDEDLPAPLDIPDGTVDTRVLLTVPLRRPHMEEAIAVERSDSYARYRYTELELSDTSGGHHPNAVVQVARLRLRLLLEGQEQGTYTALACARIAERKAGRQLELDRAYVPPCMDCRSIAPLRDTVEEILGLLNHRGAAIAERLNQPGRGGVAEIADFLLLQAVNRYEPWLAHLLGLDDMHPADLYAVLLQLAGELATFSHADHRTAAFPLYRHDDLQASFNAVTAELRKSLSLVIEQNAVPITLEERKYGVQVAIIDQKLLESAVFVLAVHARMPPDVVRTRFPAQAKLGPVERIRDLVNLALPGIGLYPLPVAPRQIPFHAGYTYFELDRSGDYWSQLQQSGGFALHVSGEFPGLELEFWAVRS